MSINAETLAEWKRDAGMIRPRQFGKTIAGRALALIAEVERQQEALGWWKREYGHKVDGLTETMAERDALQAQVDAVKVVCADALDRPCESFLRVQFARRILAALGETGEGK